MRLGLALLAAFVVLAPAMASAQNPQPSPNTSTFDPVIVGTSNGLLIGDGYHATIRSMNGTPLGGVSVSVNFQQGVFPYQQQLSPTTVDCLSLILFQTTDSKGEIFINPKLGGYQNGAVMAVKANGVFMRQIAGRSTDLDASGVTDILDFNHFRQNYVAAPSAAETDYDETGATDIGDFNIFRQAYLSGAAGVVCH